MDPLTYKLSNLHFSKQCETYTAHTCFSTLNIISNSDLRYVDSFAIRILLSNHPSFIFTLQICSFIHARGCVKSLISDNIQSVLRVPSQIIYSLNKYLYVEKIFTLQAEFYKMNTFLTSSKCNLHPFKRISNLF